MQSNSGRRCAGVLLLLTASAGLGACASDGADEPERPENEIGVPFDPEVNEGVDTDIQDPDSVGVTGDDQPGLGGDE